jgi:hypothetical protein
MSDDRRLLTVDIADDRRLIKVNTVWQRMAD